MNTNPKLLAQIADALTTIRMCSDHPALRYIEALMMHAFQAGYAARHELDRSSERDDATTAWEKYEGSN